MTQALCPPYYMLKFLNFRSKIHLIGHSFNWTLIQNSGKFHLIGRPIKGIAPFFALKTHQKTQIFELASQTFRKAVKWWYFSFAMIFFARSTSATSQIRNSGNFRKFRKFWNFWSVWKTKMWVITKIIKTYFLHSVKTFGAFSDRFLMVSNRIQVGDFLEKIRKFLI